MTNQDFGRSNDTPTPSREGKAQNIKGAASDAFAKVSDVARDAGSKAREAASETAFTVTEQVKELLDRQIGNGASVAGHFASSAKLAADDLDRNSPFWRDGPQLGQQGGGLCGTSFRIRPSNT